MIDLTREQIAWNAGFDAAIEAAAKTIQQTHMSDLSLVSAIRNLQAPHFQPAPPSDVKTLINALKPFADEMETKDVLKTHPHWPDSQSFIGFNFKLGDLRRAKSAIEAMKGCASA